PLYHALISAFERRTGIPLILNTSFNLRGMPIVESPQDALQCFLYTDMDVLYLGRFRVEQAPAGYLLPSRVQGWELTECRDIKTNTLQLVCRSQEFSKQFAMDVEPQLIELINWLDGKRSLQSAYEKAYGANADGKHSLKAVVCAIQHLVREGAME